MGAPTVSERDLEEDPAQETEKGNGHTSGRRARRDWGEEVEEKGDGAGSSEGKRIEKSEGGPWWQPHGAEVWQCMVVSWTGRSLGLREERDPRTGALTE